MRLRRRRNRAELEVVDLRADETIDLRPEPTASTEYHCMRIWNSFPPVRDPATDAWMRSASMVDYPADLEDLSADRWREALEPGPASAAILPPIAEADELADH